MIRKIYSAGSQDRIFFFYQPLYRSQVYLGFNLTDVIMADEDTSPILTDNANKAIQGNVAMQIIQSGCQPQN